MKVGLLTFPNSVSYGCVLQMYALQRTVEQLGHEAEAINYQNVYMKQERHVARLAGKPSMKDKARKIARKVLHRKMYRAFANFEKQHIGLYPEKVFGDRQTLCRVGRRYDAIICGSDQVWNPDITGQDPAYFLDFCEGNTRRVAYAPSFGIENFSEDFRRDIQGDLRRFHALSAREASGQVLVEALTGRDVPIVADPTFFLEQSDWEKLEQKHPAARGNYILYFTVRSSRTLWEKALEFSRKIGMKLVVIGGNALKKKIDGVEYAVDIGPAQWLYLMHHARYVVTNSFHGTAFSIHFRRDFYLDLSARTNSRLEHIAKALGLEDRIVKGPLEPSVTDYTVAERVLPEMRKASWAYLEQALQ